MLVSGAMGVVLVVLLGGGWLVFWSILLIIFLALLGVLLYRMRWHELVLPWMLGRFLTHKSGVTVTVQTVTLRSLQSRSTGVGGSTTQTHAVVMAEKILVANPPGYSARALSSVGRVQVLFDPWSVFAPSALVQSIHMEDIEVHLERRNGINNTRSLRMLMDVRKRARRAGHSVPLLGYPEDVAAFGATAAARASSSAAVPMRAASSRPRAPSPAEDVIISSTSESGDSDTSQEDLLDEDVGEGGQTNFRNLMAGTASEAARRARAVATSALSRSRKTSSQTSTAKSAAKVLFKSGRALKTALTRRMSTRRRSSVEKVELAPDSGDRDTRERSESLASLVEVHGEEEEGDEAREEAGLVGVGEECEDVRQQSSPSLEQPDGLVHGAIGAAEDLVQSSVEMSADELREELARMGVNLEERDLKMYEDMWHDSGHCDFDTPAASLAVCDQEDAAGRSSSRDSRKFGSVELEEIKATATSMKNRLVGSAVNSGIKVGSMMGHKVKSVMGDKFGSALGLQRRAEGAGVAGGAGTEAQPASSAEEGHEKENVGLSGSGVGEVTASIGGAKKAMLGTLKAGASTLGWGISRARVMIRTGSGGSGGSVASEEMTDHKDTAGAALREQEADSQLAEDEDVSPASSAAIGPSAEAAGAGEERAGAEHEHSVEGRGKESLGAGEVERDGTGMPQQDERRESEGEMDAGAADRSEGLSKKFRRLAAGGSKRVLDIVRGDEPASASSSPPQASTGEMMTRELLSLTRDYVDIMKGGDGNSARVAASQHSPPSPTGLPSAGESVSAEANRSRHAAARQLRDQKSATRVEPPVGKALRVASSRGSGVLGVRLSTAALSNPPATRSFAPGLGLSAVYPMH